MCIKPLRRLLKSYYRKDIPIMAWSPCLIQLFHDIKWNVTSAPILTLFDPDKPTFLKTDWSSEGMGWILMQPFYDEESIEAMQLLKTDGTCNFDLT